MSSMSKLSKLSKIKLSQKAAYEKLADSALAKKVGYDANLIKAVTGKTYLDATIYCDKREGKIIPELPDEFVYSNDNIRVLCKPKQLTIGDYAVFNKAGQLRILIERKTWQDLAGSIGGRLPKQIRNMIETRKTTDCVLVLLMEGPHLFAEKMKIGRKPIQCLKAKIDHLAVRDNFKIIYSKSKMATPTKIIEFTRNCFSMSGFDSVEPPADTTSKKPTPKDKSKESPPVTSAAPIEVESDELMGGKGDAETNSGGSDGCVSTTSLTQLTDDLTAITTTQQSTNQELVDLMWLSVPGVTMLSKPILEANEIELIGLLNGDYEIKEIATLKYNSGGKIGDKRAKSLVNKAKTKDTAIKVLANIPQLTKATAKLLMERYKSVEKLSQAKVESLAIFKKTTKTNIGPKLAQKIIDLLSLI